MAKTNYLTVDAYHAAFPETIRERLQTIRTAIHRIAPEAQEVISYQIPAFKIGKTFLIYYAAFTGHLTVSHPWSAAFLHEFASELRAYKVSKSAIQLPLNQPLPVELIERILVFRKQEIAASGR